MQIGSKEERRLENQQPLVLQNSQKEILNDVSLALQAGGEQYFHQLNDLNSLASLRALQQDRLRSLTRVTPRCLCSSHPPAASNLSMSLAQQVVSLIPRRASPKRRLAEEFVFIKIQPTITILSDGAGLKCACPAILAALFLQGKGSSATCLFTF